VSRQTAGSVLARRLSDPRAALGAAGYALALQAAHPVVAAGTRDHSDFMADPWGRFFRTVDYVMLLGYGDDAVRDALAMRLREAHRPIRGTDPQGRRYSALDPGAYAWVHATIADAIIRGHRLLGSTLDASECEAFWAEWLELGDVLGVRRAFLPATWAAFDAYRDEMIATTLEDNDVIQSLRRRSRVAVGGSPWRWIPSPLWALVGIPAARALYFVGLGMLQPELRERFGFSWSPAHQLAFDAYGRLSKVAGVVLPRWLLQPGLDVVVLRRREQGPFGVVNAEALAAG
jgi:uncharacterized protein (DUF2236 family)